MDINAGVQVISQHPSLEKLCYPVSTVVALYTLTGSDYLSSFFHKTKAKFLTALIENVDHICTHDEQLFSVTGESTVVLNQAAWHRLVLQSAEIVGLIICFQYISYALYA